MNVKRKRSIVQVDVTLVYINESDCITYIYFICHVREGWQSPLVLTSLMKLFEFAFFIIRSAEMAVGYSLIQNTHQ